MSNVTILCVTQVYQLFVMCHGIVNNPVFLEQYRISCAYKQENILEPPSFQPKAQNILPFVCLCVYV
jgi:hypothetical protein